MTPLALLASLIAAHALCDYPLQGDFLAKAKNRTTPIPGFPWYQALGAHAAIHAGAVGLLTGSLPLALAEAIAHFVTDDLKCRGRIGLNADQAIHIVCKLLWTIIATTAA